MHLLLLVMMFACIRAVRGAPLLPSIVAAPFLKQNVSTRTLTPVPSIDFFSHSIRVLPHFSTVDESDATMVTMVTKGEYKTWIKLMNIEVLKWFDLTGFDLKEFPGNGKIIYVPTVDSNGKLVMDTPSIVGFCDEKEIAKNNPRAFGDLFSNLLKGRDQCFYFVSSNEEALGEKESNILAFQYGLHQYKFAVPLGFKSSPSTSKNTSNATILWPKNCDKQKISGLLKAYTLYKDLVDSPALSCGPEQIEVTARNVAENYNATFHSIKGVEELLLHNFPQIAAVGMAAARDREPRIIDIKWRNNNDPNSNVDVVLIGKGVTFDTGGLDIKSSAGMRHMKKDMAGSAQALALGLLIMETNLPVNLRILLPIAENSISGNALRPGDIIRSRHGKTIEITNTDAEGRLILSDAIAAAVEEGVGIYPNKKPALIVDFATLTGAARVALADIPALFSNDISKAMNLWKISTDCHDLLWPMPLHEPFRDNLKSNVADIGKHLHLTQQSVLSLTRNCL